MIAVTAQLALTMMSLALVLNFWRLVVGPTSADRIVALDTMYVNTIALLVLLGIIRGSALYFEGALMVALLGFVGTVALCRFVLRGNIME